MRKFHIEDYLMLLRPSIMIALWTFYFAGIYIAMRLNGQQILFNFTCMFRIIAIMMLYSLLMGSVYVINQIVDIDTDRANNKLHILPKGIISKRNAVIYAVILAAVSLTGVFLVQSLSLTVKLLFVFAFIMGYLYSVPPFMLKRRPFFDIADNILGYGLVTLIIGFEASGYVFSPMYIIFTLPYMLSMGAVFVNTTLMDYSGDKSVNARTTGVYLGFRLSAVLALLMMAGAAISAFILKDYILAAVSAVSLPLYLYALLKPGEKSAGISVKFSAPLLTFVMSVIFPYFLIINIMAVIGMRYYYKERFNIRYPI